MYSWGLSGAGEATDCFNRVYFGLFHQCNTIQDEILLRK